MQLNLLAFLHKLRVPQKRKHLLIGETLDLLQNGLVQLQPILKLLVHSQFITLQQSPKDVIGLGLRAEPSYRVVTKHALRIQGVCCSVELLMQ